MPGLVPPVADEREALLAFLSQQRDALRYAAHGLTDEQASDRPTVSELCLAGLIKHAALVERAWTTFLVSGDTGVFVPADDWADGFRLVGRRDPRRRGRSRRRAGPPHREGGARPSTTSARRSRPPTDLVPWIPGGTVWTPRWVLLHLSRRRPVTPGTPTSSGSPSTAPTCWTVMAAAEGWPEQDWG